MARVIIPFEYPIFGDVPRIPKTPAGGDTAKEENTVHRERPFFMHRAEPVPGSASSYLSISAYRDAHITVLALGFVLLILTAFLGYSSGRAKGRIEMAKEVRAVFVANKGKMAMPFDLPEPIGVNITSLDKSFYTIRKGE
jgi:hypothetical protein